MEPGLLEARIPGRLHARLDAEGVRAVHDEDEVGLRIVAYDGPNLRGSEQRDPDCLGGVQGAAPMNYQLPSGPPQGPGPISAGGGGGGAEEAAAAVVAASERADLGPLTRKVTAPQYPAAYHLGSADLTRVRGSWVAAGTGILDPDTDDDDLEDPAETELGTKRNMAETDGGGVDNLVELNDDKDPLGPFDDIDEVVTRTGCATAVPAPLDAHAGVEASMSEACHTLTTHVRTMYG